MKPSSSALVMRALIAGLALAVPTSASAAPLVDAPVRSVAEIDRFTVGEHRVSLSAWRQHPIGGEGLCVQVEREERSEGVRIFVLESGCLEGAPYRFDPWEAAAAGTIRTEVDTWVYDETPDGWKLRTHTEVPSQVDADVTWVGTGSHQLGVQMPGIYGCYFLLVCPDVRAARIMKRASVAGSITITRLDETV